MQKEVIGQASKTYSTWWVLKMGIRWSGDGAHGELRKVVSLER